MYFYKPDYSNEINSPFARNNENKLVRRSYWLDLPDQSIILLFTNGIGKNLTNDRYIGSWYLASGLQGGNKFATITDPRTWGIAFGTTF